MKVIEVEGCHDCPHNRLDEWIDPEWDAYCDHLRQRNAIPDDEDFILENCPLTDKEE